MPPPPAPPATFLADRRYAWAEAALAEGDVEAAADLAAQVLERVPGYGPAWLLVGRARAADPARGERPRRRSGRRSPSIRRIPWARACIWRNSAN